MLEALAICHEQIRFGDGSAVKNHGISASALFVVSRLHHRALGFVADIPPTFRGRWSLGQQNRQAAL